MIQIGMLFFLSSAVHFFPVFAGAEVFKEEEGLTQEDVHAGGIDGMDDFSLFQRGQTLSKTPGTLGGLFRVEQTGVHGHDPLAFARHLGSFLDVSTAIDLLFVLLILSMFLRWYQLKQEAERNGAAGLEGSGSQKQVRRLR